MVWTLIGTAESNVAGGTCDAVVKADTLESAREKLREVLRREYAMLHQSTSTEIQTQPERLPWYRKVLSGEQDPVSIRLFHSLQQTGVAVEIEAWRSPGTSN